MYYLTHIKTDGTISTTTQEKCPSLMQLKHAVCGSIESVPFWTNMDGRRCWTICNTEGKLDGLPCNPIATALWHLMVPRMRGVDILCGDILVIACDTDEEFGEL